MAENPSTVSIGPLMQVGDIVRKQDEVAFVVDFIERSDKVRQKYVPIFDEVLANYVVAPVGGESASMAWTRGGVLLPVRDQSRKRGYSRLKDPETHQIIETVTSQALGLLLGSRDYITAVPAGRDDYDKARMLGRLLMSLMEQPGVWRTHYQLFKDAFLFGTSIIEIGWETRSRKQYVQRNGKLKIEDVTFRDRPLQRAVDIYNFYPDPSGTRIQDDMIGCAKRFTITFREAQRLAQPGPNGEPPVYDPADVEQAVAMRRKELSATRSGASGGNPRFPDIPTDMPQSMETLDGFEYWGEDPIKQSDGMSNRVITLLSGLRVRSRGNTWIDGNIPFKEIVVNPLAGRFYGLGVAEVVRFLQDSADNLLMVFNDAADLAVRMPLLVGAAFGGNDQQLRDRNLNDIIRCADPTQVKPLEQDLGVLQFAAGELMRRKMSMREASGATNPLQSIPSSDRQTATEVSELVRLASQRVEAIVLLIERDAYPWIGRTLHSRLRQFLPDGGAVATLAGEQFEVPFEAIDIDADVRFVGSRTAGSKFQKFQQYNSAATLLGSPAGQQLALLYPEILIRIFRDGLEIPDAEDIVAKATERALAMQKLQAAMQAGPAQQPGAPAGAGGEGTAGASGAAEISGEAIQ